MKPPVRIFLYASTGVFFFCLDQVCKYIARTHAESTYYLGTKWLGWEYLANKGIAFSLPFPNILLIFLTPIVIVGLIFLLIHYKRKNIIMLGTMLIIFGAMSNFIDRIFFKATIDYIRILTSIVNIADVMIASGVGLIFVYEIKRKKQIT